MLIVLSPKLVSVASNMPQVMEGKKGGKESEKATLESLNSLQNSEDRIKETKARTRFLSCSSPQKHDTNTIVLLQGNRQGAR